MRASGRSRHSDGASATSGAEVQRDLELLAARGRPLATSQPSSCGTAATCAEEETGSNSAAPWINPSATT